MGIFPHGASSIHNRERSNKTRVSRLDRLQPTRARRRAPDLGPCGALAHATTRDNAGARDPVRRVRHAAPGACPPLQHWCRRGITHGERWGGCGLHRNASTAAPRDTCRACSPCHKEDMNPPGNFPPRTYVVWTATLHSRSNPLAREAPRTQHMHGGMLSHPTEGRTPRANELLCQPRPAGYGVEKKPYALVRERGGRDRKPKAKASREKIGSGEHRHSCRARRCRGGCNENPTLEPIRYRGPRCSATAFLPFSSRAGGIGTATHEAGWMYRPGAPRASPGPGHGQAEARPISPNRATSFRENIPPGPRARSEVGAWTKQLPSAKCTPPEPGHENMGERGDGRVGETARACPARGGQATGSCYWITVYRDPPPPYRRSRTALGLRGDIASRMNVNDENEKQRGL